MTIKNNNLSMGTQFGEKSVKPLDVYVNTLAAQIERFKENQIFAGQMSGNMDGVQLRASATLKQALALFDKQQKEAKDKADWMMVLNALENRIAENENYLRGEYGEDYINTMAGLYLSEEELTSLETEEERKEALFDKYLNEDGSIKDEYKGTKVGKDIQKLWDTEKARELNAKIKRDGYDAHKDEANQLLKSKDISFAEEFADKSKDPEATEQAEEVIDNKFSNAASMDINFLTQG